VYTFPYLDNKHNQTHTTEKGQTLKLSNFEMILAAHINLLSVNPLSQIVNTKKGFPYITIDS